jgi:hypothetical protein
MPVKPALVAITSPIENVATNTRGVP